MANAQETMTIEQVLEATAGLLGRIRVPAGETEEIGVPILHAIGNLNACIEAIRRKEQEEAEDGHAGKDNAE